MKGIVEGELELTIDVDLMIGSVGQDSDLTARVIGVVFSSGALLGWLAGGARAGDFDLYVSVRRDQGGEGGGGEAGTLACGRWTVPCAS